MSRWTPKWTREQKAALFAAVFDGGKTVPAALRAAKAGQLDGCEAFDMPVSTGYDLVNNEKKARADVEAARAAVEDPRSAVQAMLAQLLSEARGELTRMQQGTEIPPQRWEELRQAARAIGEIERVARALHRDTPAKADTGDDSEQPEQPATFLERLAESEAETPTAGPGSSTHQDTQGETERATPATTETTAPEPTRAEHQTTTNENGVRVGADESLRGRAAAAARAREALGLAV